MKLNKSIFLLITSIMLYGYAMKRERNGIQQIIVSDRMFEPNKLPEAAQENKQLNKLIKTDKKKKKNQKMIHLKMIHLYQR